jgi:hypothetical protein
VAPADLFGGPGKLSPEALEAARLFDGVTAELQEIVIRLLRLGLRSRR